MARVFLVRTQGNGRLGRAVRFAAGIAALIAAGGAAAAPFLPTDDSQVLERLPSRNTAQFRALYAYSPYHHVVDGTRYPAVYLQTGEHDGRVDPMNSRKMAARLQRASGPGRPILLWTTGEGHGFGTPFEERITGWWSDRTRRLSFLRESGPATTDQGYEGYAWDERDRNGSPRTYHLAGSFETFGGGSLSIRKVSLKNSAPAGS